MLSLCDRYLAASCQTEPRNSRALLLLILTILLHLPCLRLPLRQSHEAADANRNDPSAHDRETNIALLYRLAAASALPLEPPYGNSFRLPLVLPRLPGCPIGSDEATRTSILACRHIYHQDP